MHFGFPLELSDIDLWNTDLLDTHLDLLSRDKYTGIPSKYFVCLHKIFKGSSRHVFKTSSRRLGRRKIVTLKTCWRRLQDLSWGRVEDIFKTNKCLLGNLKIIIKIFMLRRWNSTGKMTILVKPCFLPMTCLIKEIPFSFLSIACRIWIAICYAKYFMLQSVLKYYILRVQKRT